MKQRNYGAMKRRSAGQLLVEAMIALGILTVGFLGLFALLNQSLRLNRVAAESYTASYLAEEGVEIVKNLIDSNILQGRVWYCGLTGSANGYQADYNDMPPGAACPGLALSAYRGKTLNFDPATGFYSQNAGAVSTSFCRQILTNLLSGGNELQVNSRIYWPGCPQGLYVPPNQVNLEDHFWSWR